MTKDCEDNKLRKRFDMVGDYDALNASAIHLFNSMADSGFLDEARELFKPLADQATMPEVAVFTMAIVVYACAGKTMDALKVHQHDMIATGVTPASYTYTVLISRLAQDFSNLDFVGYAKKHFLEMLDRGMKPRSQTYTKVMNAIAYQEPVEEAKGFLEQRKAKGFSTYHNGFRYKDGHLTEAMQVIHMCIDLVHSNEDGNVDEATEFYNTIEQKGIEPIVLIHTSVIEAYLKFCKTKGALEAFLAMLAAGVAPNSYTYTVLIEGLAADRNFFGDAKKYLLEMMDKGKRPNAATYTAVIEGFARQEGRAAEDEGKEFVEVMMGKGFVPNAKAMREVLKGKPTSVIRRVMNIVHSKLKG
ncbi:pentatricopeptide repeat-containing protein At5g65560-like [Rosa rugosa]|uniref:pentatricopeptide repeat-containing protein At5g65560-like n=1 Tax=Rosa rugosa TaxID=74645 RepID=UPI002B40D163|nr:pentatricopeptide repeat-containing protein At5g65560-like [Rosa rugosa]